MRLTLGLPPTADRRRQTLSPPKTTWRRQGLTGHAGLRVAAGLEEIDGRLSAIDLTRSFTGEVSSRSMCGVGRQLGRVIALRRSDWSLSIQALIAAMSVMLRWSDLLARFRARHRSRATLAASASSLSPATFSAVSWATMATSSA